MVFLEILFEDDALLAINKPSGLPSQETKDPARPHALYELQSLRPSETLYLVHRLDVGTSGVLLFAKTPCVQTFLTQQFREKKVHKTYLAICHGVTKEKTWIKQNYLKEKKTDLGVKMVAVHSGGVPAKTAFQILNSKKNCTAVLASPETGRRHQIRTHLADANLPIYGDPLYGGPRHPRLLLHALSLQLPGPHHPHEKMMIRAAVPKTFMTSLPLTESDLGLI